MTTVHTIKFRGQRWTCRCHARGVGQTSAEAHAFDTAGTVELGALR